MKNLKIPALACISAIASCQAAPAQEWSPAEWPVMKHYDGEHLYRIALPLGGIGTGTVSIGGRGELRDWEIMNVPAKNFSTVTIGNNAPFFAIYVKREGKKSQTRLLEGPLYDHEFLHYEGRPTNHHGFPRFSSASFDAAYPFGQVNLSDSDMPVKVRIKGFNPLVPADADASSIPIAILTYEVTNTGNVPAEVAVCGSIRNFVGKDGSKFRTDWKGDYIPTGASKNHNVFRQSDGLKGVYMYSEGVDSLDAAWGTLALSTNSPLPVSYRKSSVSDSWNNSILNFWDDFSDDGVMNPDITEADDDPMASLSLKGTIAPGKTEDFTFFITWNFPNRRAWSSTTVGNYYSGQYTDAWDVAEKTVKALPSLEKETLSFVNAFSQSSYPDVIKEAALFNLSTLRSQTVFRIPSGHLMGWEGVMDRFGSCQGSCTHVWNYETATPYLFGSLAQTMRDVEFNYATNAKGLMNFRAALPLSEAAKGSSAAADGQMGCLMKLYREWQLSGDNKFLSDNWEQAKKVLSYAWEEKGWDGDRDGVMEGSQHNTMDVNYFGPNPQMGFWYLGALRATEEMAKAVGDKDFARQCRSMYENGSRWMDTNLFNGEYYEHHITDPKTFQPLDPATPENEIPAFQLGKGCLVDQLVGQYMASLCDLGYLGEPDNIRTTLRSIMKYNFVDDFSGHFNNMRSYVMGNEAGLLMASWPKGRLKVPFPYFAEVMTGFEYCAATGMLYEGMEDDALTCIRAIRDRFDGAKRNPFSEPECGHHYARAMASWSTVLAWSRFSYSGVNREMTFTSRPGTYFWSNGYAWGTCKVDENSVPTLTVLKGNLPLKTLHIGQKKYTHKKGTVTEGQTVTFS